MRTLNSNQITEKVSTTKGYTWNLKRRYRQNLYNNHKRTKIQQYLKLIIMRTLNSNQITEKVSTSKGYTWNLKRRYR